ncbi:hypothetical protein OH76DRAFT_1156832 [Lentinus brumalis]|uniref:Uncharacterized protein n=1 Tax=Lentinus brumalis TaxID=2498619 RepID=A0A371DMU3_9APHY|nr:hypothetical protein OH76DRAFT_1156832 [Polyporus brumalis]
MTSQYPPSSASTAPPTFQEGRLPGDFLVWLKSVNGDVLDPTLARNEKGYWVDIVRGFVPCILIQHPSGHPWQTLHENVELLERALQFSLHAVCEVPLFFKEQESLAEAIFARVASVAVTLALWIDVDPPPQEGYATPTELYNAARTTCITTLHELGTEIDPETAVVHRGIMRDVIASCTSITYYRTPAQQLILKRSNFMPALTLGIFWQDSPCPRPRRSRYMMCQKYPLL